MADARDAIARLRELHASYLDRDCGDNSCVFARTRTGMRTNGGCRCMERSGTQSVARRLIAELPALLDVAEAALKTVDDCESTAACMRSEIDRGIAIRQSFESKQARIDVSEGAAATLRPALAALAKVAP